jgi:addiction module HigA family antidote
MAIQLHRAFAVHPGLWLRSEIVNPSGAPTVGKLAEHLGVTRQALSALLNGKAGLSAMMALRFEKAYGIKAETLLRMQAAFDLARAREQEAELRVDRIFFEGGAAERSDEQEPAHA